MIQPNTKMIYERRTVLRKAASIAALAVAGCAAKHERPGKSKTEEEEAEVTPGEDLMQEHGVLERLLLIYDEVIRRTEHRQSFDARLVVQAAEIVRHFVEDYHEKLEEEFIFPRLQGAQREPELVAVLLRQHEAGRQLTDAIVRQARSGALRQLAPTLRSFVRMYRPHAAREDTVLFPAFRDLVGGQAYRDLGEQFEEREHQLFGERGFEGTVERVAEIERTLSIHDLAKFTPT